MTLHRSLMFVPGDNDRALAKAASLSADVLIIDLEDAVAPENKVSARDKAIALAGENPQRQVLIRCNGLDTPWYAEDLSAIAASSAAGVLVPKVDGPSGILAVEQRLVEAGNNNCDLWAMVETPLGVLHVDEIASATARLKGFVAGLEDLRTSLRAEKTVDRAPLSYALQRILLAARAYDMVAIDSPYAAYKDSDGLALQVAQARAMGFDGKACIHPAQLEAVNSAFTPSAAAVDAAHAIVDAWDAALEAGKSVATLEGQMIERLHVADAERVILTHREAATAG